MQHTCLLYEAAVSMKRKFALVVCVPCKNMHLYFADDKRSPAPARRLESSVNSSLNAAEWTAFREKNLKVLVELNIAPSLTAQERSDR